LRGSFGSFWGSRLAQKGNRREGSFGEPLLIPIHPDSMLTFISWHVYPPPLDLGFEASARGLGPGGYLSADDDVLYSILDMDFGEFPFPDGG
jgi:hypothetical protein